MPKWRIELTNGLKVQIDASTADIQQIRTWLDECEQPFRQISLIAEGAQLTVMRPRRVTLPRLTGGMPK